MMQSLCIRREINLFPLTKWLTFSSRDTHGNPFGIFSSNFFTLDLPSFKRVFLLVMKLHRSRTLARDPCTLIKSFFLQGYQNLFPIDSYDDSELEIRRYDDILLHFCHNNHRASVTLRTVICFSTLRGREIVPWFPLENSTKDIQKLDDISQQFVYSSCVSSDVLSQCLFSETENDFNDPFNT